MATGKTQILLDEGGILLVMEREVSLSFEIYSKTPTNPIRSSVLALHNPQ
jgi:hypothetical protein